MPRPRKKVTKHRVNLSLDPALHAAAQEFAFQKNDSLSSLVERLLQEAMAAEARRAEAEKEFAELNAEVDRVTKPATRRRSA